MHLHLEIALRLGWASYEDIANGWELAEALYFSLYSPKDAEAILARTRDAIASSSNSHQIQWTSSEFVEAVEKATHDTVADLDLSSYKLVGFSVGALQLGASLYLGKTFKDRAPHLKVIFGGGNVLGEPGGRLLEQTPWLDAVVDGEGEVALEKLSGIDDAWPEAELKAIPNLWFRNSERQVERTRTRVLGRLNASRAPDMEDFYRTARDAGFPSSELVLPVEASRGCEWEHRGGDGKLRGCTFCGLYRNSPNFRERSVDSVLSHIRHGVDTYGALELSFVDAYLPTSNAKELLREISSLGRDTTLFCELRCDMDEEMASLLAAAGARKVQLGVEAFSTKLLARMAKGMRLVNNVSSIKLCEEFGIPYQYNIITRFPGVSAKDIDQMTDVLPALHGYRPPVVARFYLDRGSRVFQNPGAFHIAADSLDRDPLPFFPPSLNLVGISQVVPYEDDRTNEEASAAWSRLERGVADWAQRHAGGAGSNDTSCLLTYRDTGTVVTIHDRRGESIQIIELTAELRLVFHHCERMVRRQELYSCLPLALETVDSAIAQLIERRLVIEDGAWLLALPVRPRLPSGAPRRWASVMSASN